jgi:hypothetical protein
MQSDSWAGVRGARFSGVRVAHAVERLGQDARARRLADPAYPGEEKGVGDAPGIDGIPQRSGNVVLPDQIGEAHGAPLAREDDVAHSR